MFLGHLSLKNIIDVTHINIDIGVNTDIYLKICSKRRDLIYIVV